MLTLEERVLELESRMSGQEENSRKAKENTEDLLNIFNSAKLGARVIIFMAHVFNWAGKFALMGLALWAAWKYGLQPKLPS